MAQPTLMLQIQNNISTASWIRRQSAVDYIVNPIDANNSLGLLYYAYGYDAIQAERTCSLIWIRGDTRSVGLVVLRCCMATGECSYCLSVVRVQCCAVALLSTIRSFHISVLPCDAIAMLLARSCLSVVRNIMFWCQISRKLCELRGSCPIWIL